MARNEPWTREQARKFAETCRLMKSNTMLSREVTYEEITAH